MISKNTKKALPVILSFVLLSVPCHPQDQAPAPSAGGGNPTDAAPQSASDLQSLLAPIALYPDSLVAQILTGATFPDQIAIADYWLQQNKSLTGSDLMLAVDKQSWDASVKALTQFPSVLDNMAKNLTWTSSVGEAYHNQQSDVMTAIQTLRAQAKAKGSLQTNSQITVVQQSPQTIVIQPANPQIVYVPQYNPTVVYGTPYVVPASYVAPAYSAGDVAAAGIIGFGAGIAVGAMMSHGCCSWGYSSWNCGWHGTAVVYHGGAYYGNSAWHGGYYNGGYHNGGYHNGYGYNNNYNRNNYNNYNRNTSNTYNRNNNTINVNKSSAQNFEQSHPSAQSDAQNYKQSHPSSSNSWAQHGSTGSSHSNAWGSHSGGSDGWSSKAESSRGWGSMHSSGYSGGRFGGGGRGGGGFRR